ncbi:MAG: hypothetical protein J6Y32_04095 [Bacteroidales bacterium]|nr:hypothetical protein [Bacteroidales bacterium]
MENTKISTHKFRSDEIISLVLLGIGVTREDISTYKDYSYSDGTYLRLRISDHGLFLQNWYKANKEKRESGEPVPKLNIGQNLAITFALNEDECKERNIPFPQKIKNVTRVKTALKTCVDCGELYLEPINDATKFMEWEDTSNLPPRKIVAESEKKVLQA